MPRDATPLPVPTHQAAVPLYRQLMLLVAAVSLPMALLGAGALWNQYQKERGRAEAQLVAQARALALLVDREFERALLVGQTLAASTILARGDLDAMEAELRRARQLLSADLPPGAPPAMLRLVRADGIRLLDTNWALGERRADPVRIRPHMAEALSSGRPRISDLFIAEQLGLPMISMAVPLRPLEAESDGAAHTGTIGIGVPRERLLAIVDAAGLQAGGFASVHDRQGATVARSLRDAEALGQPAAPEVLAALLRAPEGIVPGGARTLEGVASAIAFARAPESGFTVKLELPEAALLEPLKASLLRSAAIGALVLAGGLLVAWLLAARVVAAFRQVPRLALAGHPARRGTGLREADEVVAALTAALAERSRAEQALQESETRFRTLTDTMPQMVWSALPDGRHDYFNARWQDFTGMTTPPEAPSAWLALIHPADRPALAEAWSHSLRSGEAYAAEGRLRQRDGDYGWVLVRALPMRDAAGRIARWFAACTEIQEIVAARDVLARDRAELEQLVAARGRDLEATQARLAMAQRMQALGQMAGGIAHDFNNVLQAVQGGALLLRRQAGSPDGVRRLSRLILEATERGAAITRRLLAFARRGDLRSEPVDAAALLREMHAVLGLTLGSGVEVVVQADPALPPLLADKSQLETVLINLAANARDAMAGKGQLTLAARAETMAAPSPDHPAGLQPGAYLRLSVQDNGSGMDAETLARASEPFFTTKAVGKGTGLGLSMARGFAEQSGGGLAIISQPGQGTTVCLWFPQAEAPPRPAGGEPPAALPQQALPPDRRRQLLLVDDEAVVREVLAEQLEEAGYAVLTAASAEAALELLEAGKPVDLLVTDLSMPGMDGLGLIQAAQQLRPAAQGRGLPAILLTGFVNNAAEIALGGVLQGSFSLLNKPIDGRRLAERIELLLAAQPAR